MSIRSGVWKSGPDTGSSMNATDSSAKAFGLAPFVDVDPPCNSNLLRLGDTGSVLNSGKKLVAVGEKAASGSSQRIQSSKVPKPKASSDSMSASWLDSTFGMMYVSG